MLAIIFSAIWYRAVSTTYIGYVTRIESLASFYTDSVAYVASPTVSSQLV